MTETTAPAARFARDKRATVVVWAVLTASTVLAWQLTPGHTASATSLGKELVGAITVLGFVKCRLVLRYFMEIRRAPRWLRICTDAWLVVLWASLFGIYLWT